MKEFQLLQFKKIINNQEITIKELLDVIDKQKIYIEKLQQFIPQNNTDNEIEIEWVPE